MVRRRLRPELDWERAVRQLHVFDPNFWNTARLAVVFGKARTTIWAKLNTGTAREQDRLRYRDSEKRREQVKQATAKWKKENPERLRKNWRARLRRKREENV